MAKRKQAQAMDETRESDGAPAPPRRDQDRALAGFEAALLLSRWLQIPLLVGLVVGLIVFEFKFAAHLIETITNLDTLTREQAILFTLDLIDMVLIANLVVMVVISGYETFISPLHMASVPNVPNWMRRTTAGQLKFRIATTILLISTIHLLHTYLDPNPVDKTEWTYQLLTQVVFILTCAGIVLFNYIESKTRSEER